jgi:hypothetical protein
MIFLLLVIFNVYSLENLALNKKATNSSYENNNFRAENAFDGDLVTRWASSKKDPEWLKVDLGSEQTIGLVVLTWESAYGKKYEIETSVDDKNWISSYSVTNGNGGIDILLFSEVIARYVRMYGTTRGTDYGYSLWEFEVYRASEKWIYASDQNSPVNSGDCGSLSKPCKTVGYAHNYRSSLENNIICIYKIVTEGQSTTNSMTVINTNGIKVYGIAYGRSGYVFCFLYFVILSRYDETHARWVMRNNNDDGSRIRINQMATFIDIHFILPVKGRSDGFFFIGNENSGSKLFIKNCVFSSKETDLKTILAYNYSINGIINATELIMDGISCSDGHSAIKAFNSTRIELYLTNSSFLNCSSKEYLLCYYYYYHYLVMEEVLYA